MSSTISQLVIQLQDKMKVDRTTSLVQLRHKIEDVDTREQVTMELSNFISSTLAHEIKEAFESTSWETLHGCLLALRLLADKGCLTKKLLVEFSTNYNSLIQSREVTIRNETASLFEPIAKLHGTKAFLYIEDDVISGIDRYLSLSTEYSDAPGSNQCLSPTRKTSGDLNSQFNGAITWKYLEGYLETLCHIIKGCGQSMCEDSGIESLLTAQLMDKISQSSRHPNRFIRESAFNLITAFLTKPANEQNHAQVQSICVKWQTMLSECIAKGLSDNWSQVRMSGCFSARKFLLSLPNLSLKEIYPILLPPLCLNRYYEAQGVRAYSLDTWKLFTEERGQELVVSHLKVMMEFYFTQSQMENHAVRTAAVSCFNELIRKLPKDQMEAYSDLIYSCMHRTITDSSWPVKEASCYLVSSFVSNFPNCDSQSINLLLPELFQVLGDFIPVVRQAASFALSDLVTNHPKMKDEIFCEIEKWLLLVLDHPIDSPFYSDPVISPTHFGVVKAVHGQFAFPSPPQDSLNSTASASRSTNSSGNSSNASSNTNSNMVASTNSNNFSMSGISKPWMKADGSVYLLAEFSRNNATHKNIISILPNLAKSTNARHYSHHVQYFETICRALPIISKEIGKKQFKPFLDSFFDMIFYSLDLANQPTSKSARECLTAFDKLIGHEILRSRIENYNPDYTFRFDEILTH